MLRLGISRVARRVPRPSRVLLPSTHILSYQFHATAAARDRGPFENKFGELCAIMGDKKAKEIVERNESLLQNVSGITATFAAVVNVMGGGENGTQRAKNIVD